MEERYLKPSRGLLNGIFRANFSINQSQLESYLYFNQPKTPGRYASHNNTCCIYQSVTTVQVITHHLHQLEPHSMFSEGIHVIHTAISIMFGLQQDHNAYSISASLLFFIEIFECVKNMDLKKVSNNNSSKHK